MKRNILRSRFELTIVLTLFFVLCYAAYCDTIQQRLSEDVLRLRVVAASDEKTDQEIKLRVRDSVLEIMRPLQEKASDRQEMQQLLREHMQEIANTAQQTVYDCGREERITACLAEEWYPTREYDTFSLPAGTYEGLQIRIGSAEGHNWWCVLYPALCLDTADGETELTEEERSLIHREGEVYEIRFRTTELLGSLRGMLS